MDLGYANKMVAAKTWAALFATRDWAVKAEKGALDAPPATPEPTLKDLTNQLCDNEEAKKRLAQWKPRSITLRVDLSETGLPEEFEENTPERKLAEFLAHWKANNYGHMARCVTAMFGEPTNKMASQVRELYKGRTLDRFRFEMIEDEAAAITTIHVRIWGREQDEEVEQLIEVRLMNEDEQGKAAIRGTTGSKWALVGYGLNLPVSD